MSTRWPLVVEYLLAHVPAIPEWAGCTVFDTHPVTASAVPVYAVIARTVDDTTSGSFVRQLDPSMLVSESGVVRVNIVTRTGSIDPVGMRDSGFALVDALEVFLLADHTLGGVLGAASTTTLSADVRSISDQQGIAQSLVVSINYSSLNST